MNASKIPVSPFDHFISNPRVIREFDQFSNKIRAHQYAKPFTTLLPLLSSDTLALDWGSGNGHLSTFLIENNQRTTAFAFGNSSVPDIIKDDPRLTFIRGDTNEPTALPFADATFDLVFSMGVLEHVHETGGDQLASLKEINRILKHDGLFLCFHFPYSGSWVEALHNLLMPLKRKKSYTHSRRFSRRDVVRLTGDSGFTLLEWERYNFLPRNTTKHLPVSLCNNSTVVSCFNALDALGVLALPWICNQSCFIARKT